MKKVLSLMLVVMLCVGMMPMTVFADNEVITYLDENRQQATITDYEAVNSSTTTLEGGTTYVVMEDCTWDSAANTAVGNGNPVKLILCDDAELTLTKGLNMGNADVIIYGQAGGTGKLTISTTSDVTTIDDGAEQRTLTVNGGIVTVSGDVSDDSRAIDVYNFVLNGGKVSATGGDSDQHSKGISTDTITVNGGELIAKGGRSTKSSFGISTQNFTLKGGAVTAEGGDISGDNALETAGLKVYQNATISGGTFTATGGNITKSKMDTPSSNGVFLNTNNTANISGGTINATGGNVATTATNSTAQSYGFQAAGKLNFSGGSITATAGTTVAKTTFSNPLLISTLNVSVSDFILPKASRVGNIEVSGNVKMIDLLDSGCAFVHWGQKYDANAGTTTREPIGAASLKDSPTKLTGIPNDTSTYTYGYFLVNTCGTHSYVGGECEYCGTKQPASKPSGGSSEPTYTPTVTQPTVGGSVEVNNTAPTEGETVVVTPKKDNGYVIDTIKVTDENGKTIEISRNADGTFDFTQPDGEVTIEVTYTEKPDFKDVPKDAWYGEALDFAVENGILSGTSKTTFAPNESMTRAMFATVLWCYVGKPDGFTGSFNDIKNGDWFQDAVTWASKNNVVSGTGNGKFEPDLEITREQMVVMLWNFCGKPSASGKLDSFTDANKVSSWAQAAMAWAVENGIINGKGNGVLDPLGTAARAEVTAMIVNFMDK